LIWPFLTNHIGNRGSDLDTTSSARRSIRPAHCRPGLGNACRDKVAVCRPGLDALTALISPLPGLSGGRSCAHGFGARSTARNDLLSGPGQAVAVDLVAETTRAFFVPCAQIGLYVCVAPGEFGKQTDPLMPMSAWFDSGPTTVLDVSHPHERSCPLTHIINKNH
jgi:hypothetical protein